MNRDDFSKNNFRFLNEVQKWFSVLLPLIKKYLYGNGGPILMVQVENEYGFYGCDHNYTDWLSNKTRDILGEDTVLFTSLFLFLKEKH